MLKEKEAVIRRALILFDGFLVSFAFFLSYYLRQYFHGFYKFDLLPFSQVVAETTASKSDYFLLLFFVAPFWCLMLYLNGMYYSLRTRRFLEILGIIIKSSFFTFLAFGTMVFLFKLRYVSRMFFAIFVVTSFVFALLGRVAIFSFIHYARKKGYNYRAVLIVGTGRRAASFIKKIQTHPEWGFKILGVIEDEPGRGIEEVSDIEVIGTLKDIPDILHREAIDEIIFVVPRSRLSHIEHTIYDCEIEGVKTTLAVDLFDLKIARSRPTELDDIPLLRFETTVAKEWQLFIKRIMDLVISGLGLILLSPLFLFVTILIKLSSSGPILFKQERLGLNSRKFILYKFRTMYKGAQEALSKVEDLNVMHGDDFKKKKIKWITLAGRLLRKFSLDELPQLFNVFIGHMSIIGPRPTVPDEVEKYKSWQRRRFSMKPGITCLWQIKGRNKMSYDEWMKLDLEYLDNWSLGLDLKILIKTIPVVLFGIGAY